MIGLPNAENAKKFFSEAKKLNEEFHYFNVFSEDLALEEAKQSDSKKSLGKLSGYFVSVKDNVCVKGVESTASSKILKGYFPVFDATVIERSKNSGGIIVGKTVQDEFGFGSFSINVGLGFQKPLNPFDSERVCGGSSGGSAGITAKTSFSHVSIAESTGGSIVCPASFCGVVGFCPTYGRVSRNGLIDYANSLDKIGTMGKNVRDAALLLEVISGFDEKDSTSLNEPVEEFSKFVVKTPADVKGLKIGIVKEFFGKGIDVEVKKTCLEKIDKLEKAGAIVEEISLPLNAKYGVACYYLIAMAEASTNLARYNGMKYGEQTELKGTFNDYFSGIRSENFGEEAKRRIILGTFARMSGFRDAYYLKAMKVRTKLIEEFRTVFKKFDVLANPTMAVIAPKFSEAQKLSPMQNYAMDLCTVPANLAGLPHISVNAGFSQKMPVGLMFTANYLNEKALVKAASAVELLK